MNFLKTVVSLGLGGSSCHGRPVVHPFFPAPSPLFAVCIRRTPSARQAALAQADQAAHGFAARAPDMGVKVPFHDFVGRKQRLSATATKIGAQIALVTSVQVRRRYAVRKRMSEEARAALLAGEMRRARHRWHCMVLID